MVTEYGPYHVHLGGHVNRELNHNCEPLGNVGGEYCSAGDIWEYLKTFLVPVTRCMCGRVGGALLESCGSKPGTSLNRDPEHPTKHGLSSERNYVAPNAATAEAVDPWCQRLETSQLASRDLEMLRGESTGGVFSPRGPASSHPRC